MVQGPHEWNAAIQPVASGANGSQNRNRRQQQPPAAVPPPTDTVQISRGAAQAAAHAALQRQAVTAAIQAGAAVAVQPATPAIAPVSTLRPATVPAAGPVIPVSAPGAVTQANLESPAAPPASTGPAGAGPEVRPGRVAQAARNLASINGQGAAAVNASIAQKLLTGF